MKKIVKFFSCLLLLLLTACNSNNQTLRFREWNLKAPTSELMYSFSSKDRGFHGDGIDCYIFKLTPDYNDYLISLLKGGEDAFTCQESSSNFSSEITQEIIQIDNSDILNYLYSMNDNKTAQVVHDNDKLIIIIDENNEQITFVFSLY